MEREPVDDLERDLAAAVAALPRAERASVLQAVALMAAERCGIADRCRASTDVAALVRDLDDAAWQLQTEVDEGRRPYEDYATAFAAARAANAWLDAADASNVDRAYRAAYEAAHALGGDANAFRAVLSLLRQ